MGNSPTGIYCYNLEMPKKIMYCIVAGAVLILAVWYSFFRSGATEITNFPSSGTDIIAFGDSLVAGTGATDGNDFVSLLSQATGREIVSLGVPGNTTADGLARIDELDRYMPKVVLLLLGGNDHLKKVPIETTFTNLGKIIENIHSKGAIVLLLGVKGNLFGDKFEPEFEKLRDKYKTAYVSNVLDGLFRNPKLMEDSIHPNDAGNKVIAERIYPVLAPLLK
ncbi:MAG: Lipolytic protein family [Candidatus Kaiserbacteria bacterium GW2011_GWA2_49_19]|uniref:Lipolytic protein family n=2 Tax=Candidatus Kaiseribacteriota TaxID=1752734 RepID=A0A0G1VR46_9BACT|nr:MAG: Lipolytic protein family [Candidatus Kaiserbacteria bacterium GW2011_GWA2_49_19]